VSSVVASHFKKPAAPESPSRHRSFRIQAAI
jgi:hypothetical protein